MYSVGVELVAKTDSVDADKTDGSEDVSMMNEDTLNVGEILAEYEQRRYKYYEELYKQWDI